jgi:hypothetical protein
MVSTEHLGVLLKLNQPLDNIITLQSHLAFTGFDLRCSLISYSA